jgi:probable LLM family oxidoreductase
MELGIATFVETPEPHIATPHQRMVDLMEEIELADQLKLDVIAIGEHHREDYLVSAPPVVLAAAAMRTKHAKLSSAVTVLSSDDPVRVYQQFATVDLLSGGRAEIMAGRGSFIESFPLFGYSLNDYNSLYAEKLELLKLINENERVTWSGRHRAPIKDLGVYPRAHQPKIPIWVAVGGTPESLARAAKLGLPVMIAIIGGAPARFKPLVDYYKQMWVEAGHPLEKIQFGINSHGYIATSSEQASEELFPSYHKMMSKIGKERGWPPMSRQDFEMSRTHGPLLVGSPQQVIDKILYEYELFGNTRFLLQVTSGPIEHLKVMRSIELFGTHVAPVVRKELAAK